MSHLYPTLAKLASHRSAKIFLAIGLLIFGFSETSEAKKQSDNEKKKPNILLIVADDQSPFDFHLYNSRSTLKTPAIDQLAKNGVVFHQAYHMGAWSGAVCTASRHMIMTGRSVWHIPSKPGRFKNPNERNTKLVPKNLEKNSLAAVFNRAGYETMRTCKKGNSFGAANKQFQIVHDKTRRDAKGSDWHGDRVLEYLENRESQKEKKPFLIYMGFSHPHDTRTGKPELLKKYGAVNHKDRKTIPPLNDKQPLLPINYLPKHPFDNGVTKIRDEVRVKGVWDRRDENTIRNELGRQYACSENIDLQIAKVIKKLKESGELKNTYIIYTSDHGIAIGRHGLQGKQNLYEHSWRVPMIVSGPGIKPNANATGNVYLSDLLATLCDFADIAPPKTNQGTSFLPVLHGKKKVVRDTLYGVYTGNKNQIMRSLRKGDWKLITYKVQGQAEERYQLFNLKTNPLELLIEHREPKTVKLIGQTPDSRNVNLANDARYSKKLQEMKSALKKEQLRLHDPYTDRSSSK